MVIFDGESIMSTMPQSDGPWSGSISLAIGLIFPITIIVHRWLCLK
jgi:hypothetical protein